MEIEAQTEKIWEIKNLGKLTRTKDASITNIIQEIEKRMFGIEDRVEEIDTSVKILNLKSSSWFRVSTENSLHR